MSLLAKIRSGQARWGHASLALLTFAWLNVVLQPCAMAMAGDFGDCHHVASGHGHEPASHETMAGHGHDMAAGQAEDHGDRQGDDAESRCTDCRGDLADCAHLSDINKSERSKQPAPDHGIAWLVLPATAYTQPVDPRPPPSSGARDAARLSGAFPPLSVLYCVYLD